MEEEWRGQQKTSPMFQHASYTQLFDWSFNESCLMSGVPRREVRWEEAGKDKRRAEERTQVAERGTMIEILSKTAKRGGW